MYAVCAKKMRCLSTKTCCIYRFTVRNGDKAVAYSKIRVDYRGSKINRESKSI